MKRLFLFQFIFAVASTLLLHKISIGLQSFGKTSTEVVYSITVDTMGNIYSVGNWILWNG